MASRVIVLRNIRRVLWLLLGAALLAEAGILIYAYVHDHLPVDQATYVGTFMAVVLALLTVVRRIARDPGDSVLRLQERLTLSISDRLSHLRLTPNEIELIVASSTTGDLLDLPAFVDAVAGVDIPRVLLTGTRGGGKSYVVLRVAQKIITSTDCLPVVVPLSRWSEGKDIESFLSDFLHDEFNLSRRTQQLLLAQARIVPIFDGLDEIPDLDRRAVTLVDFVQQLRSWRPVPDGTRYVVSIRDEAWQSVDLTVRGRLGAERFTIADIDPDTAAAFLAESVPLTRPAEVAQDLMSALQKQQLYQQVNWASRLSMLGVLLAEDAGPEDTVDGGVERIVTAVREQRLPAIYLATLLARGRARSARLLNSLAVAALSDYARYLQANAAPGGRVVAHRRLNPRNILLHRLWPVSGQKARVADVLLALVLSAPGLAWLADFMSRFAAVGWSLWAVFTFSWMAMLGRTASKAWVPAAVLDPSRLTSVRFIGRQAGASVLLGVITWCLAPPWVALAVAVTAWLLIGLSVGFGQTLTSDDQVRVVGPAGVLQRERQVSLLAGAAAFPMITIAFGSTFGIFWGPLLSAAYCLLVGATVASALWRRYLALCIVRCRDLLTPAAVMRRTYRLNIMREGGLTYQFREDEIAAHVETLPRSWRWAWRASRSIRRPRLRLPIE